MVTVEGYIVAICDIQIHVDGNNIRKKILVRNMGEKWDVAHPITGRASICSFVAPCQPSIVGFETFETVFMCFER